MTTEECNLLINKALSKVQINIEESCLEAIISESQGHPYILESLGYVLHIDLAEDDKILTTKNLESSMPAIMGFLANEFFAVIYSKLSPNAKKILVEIAKQDKIVQSELAKRCNKSSGYLGPYLTELVQKEAITKVERGEYKIFHNLFAKYVLSLPQ